MAIVAVGFFKEEGFSKEEGEDGPHWYPCYMLVVPTAKAPIKFQQQTVEHEGCSGEVHLLHQRKLITLHVDVIL